MSFGAIVSLGHGEIVADVMSVDASCAQSVHIAIRSRDFLYQVLSPYYLLPPGQSFFALENSSLLKAGHTNVSLRPSTTVLSPRADNV